MHHLQLPSGHPRVAVARLAPAICVAVISVAYISWYLAVYSVFPADDAYIHMRLARHMAEHGLPYFNLDEPVAASSSPLWLLTLSAVFALWGPNPQLLLPLLWAVTVALFTAVAAALRGRASPTVAVAAAALIVVVGALRSAAIQMETPLALLLWALSLTGLRRCAYTAAGLLAALAACTRYELMLWVVLVAVAAPDMQARRRIVLGAALPLAALALFNLHYFGSLLPNTIRAKSIIYSLDFAQSVASSGFLFVPWLFELMLTLGGVLAVACLRRTGTRWTGAALLFGLGLIALYILRRVLIFTWYTPLFLVPTLFGLVDALHNLPMRERLLAAIVAVMLGVSPVGAATAEASGLFAGRPAAFAEAGAGLRVRRYLSLGAELYRDYPDAVLLTSEIGGLGWSFSGRIADGAGLTSPELLRFHPMAVPAERASGATGAIPPQAVGAVRPGLIVSMESFSVALRRDMASGRLAGYQLLLREPVLAADLVPELDGTELWGSRYTEVYISDELAAHDADAAHTPRPVP